MALMTFNHFPMQISDKTTLQKKSISVRCYDKVLFLFDFENTLNENYFNIVFDRSNEYKKFLTTDETIKSHFDNNLIKNSLKFDIVNYYSRLTENDFYKQIHSFDDVEDLNQKRILYEKILNLYYDDFNKNYDSLNEDLKENMDEYINVRIRKKRKLLYKFKTLNDFLISCESLSECN